jgi:Asp-tRNA(Asn)/Glu-tRNA(Gln) amidotransferase A subunit family amidase
VCAKTEGRRRVRVRQSGDDGVRVSRSVEDKNPWNPRHTPGGSSSGPCGGRSPQDTVTGAIGTQTNGSVIRPAAFCGVVGFKPTKDAIPLDGVHLFSDTLDQLGTFTRSVADAARLASALAPSSIASAAGTARDDAALRSSRAIPMDAGSRSRCRRVGRRRR